MINRSGTGVGEGDPEVVFTAPILGMYLVNIRGTFGASMSAVVAGFGSATTAAPHAAYFAQLTQGQEIPLTIFGTNSYDVSVSFHLVGSADLSAE